MPRSARPSDEAARFRALTELEILDTEREERFDRITRLASTVLRAEVALVNLIDVDRQWTKSWHGLEVDQMPLEHSLCRHAVDDDDVLVVPDLTADDRFAGLPVVVEQGMQFYAGAPLHDLTGVPLGTLCVLDTRPRQLSDAERAQLVAFAGWAEAEVNTRVVRRAARQAELSESRMRALLDGAPGAVLLLDGTSRVQWANQQACEMFGLPQARLVGTPLVQLVPDLDLRDLRGQARRADDAPGGTGRRLFQAGRRADGARFTTELFVSRLPETPERYAVFARDVDAERGEGQRLARLRERNDVIFDALGEGVVVVEADGRIGFVNLAAARLVGSRRDDLVGRQWHDAVHARCTDPSCDLADLLVHAGRQLSPVELHRSDATSTPVEVSVRLTGGGADGPAIVATLADLTERLAVDRLKTDFVSSVSHELRTPLTSIRGSLGLLVAGAVDPTSDSGRRMLEIAASSSERLVRLVNDILDLERLQSQGVELQIAPQRTAALLAAATQAVAGAATEAGVRLDVAETGTSVLADADRAVQVLVNLLGNAIKFSPAGSAISVAAERRDGVVAISVRDPGRGIPQEQLERIFERFSQVDSGDRKDKGGTGLGLTIARTLAEQHGGRLTAESTVGQGSTFTLELPAATGRSSAEPAAAAPAVPPPAPPGTAERATAGPPSKASLPEPTGTGPGAAQDDDAAARPDRRVLLVEDDADLADVLATALSRHGLVVEVAHDQGSAVRLAQQWRPDVLLLDLVLSGGDGFGVVDALRDDTSLGTVPLVVYSVLEPTADERARLTLGATTFLTKSKDGAEEVEEVVLRLLTELSATTTAGAEDQGGPQ